LAARYALRNGTSRVALVTTDAFRIGAQEQLRAFGALIGVSVYAVNEIEDLHQTLEAIQDRDLVIIDTAGLSQRDMQLLEQLAVLRTGEIKIDPYLVVSATTQEQALDETVAVFNRIELKGAILSKLDEGGELGAAVSVLLRHRLPLLYLGNGQRVPEDLQVARGRELVDQLVSQKRNEKERLTLLQGGLQHSNRTQITG
jgi:flagellar biosynthesis protein FlhF